MKQNTYLQKALEQLRHCSPAAEVIFRVGLMLWGYLLFCALVLLLRGHPWSMETYRFYVLAAKLQRAAITVYFCTGFLACFVEERSLK